MDRASGPGVDWAKRQRLGGRAWRVCWGWMAAASAQAACSGRASEEAWPQTRAGEGTGSGQRPAAGGDARTATAGRPACSSRAAQSGRDCRCVAHAGRPLLSRSRVLLWRVPPVIIASKRPAERLARPPWSPAPRACAGTQMTYATPRHRPSFPCCSRAAPMALLPPPAERCPPFNHATARRPLRRRPPASMPRRWPQNDTPPANPVARARRN